MKKFILLICFVVGVVSLQGQAIKSSYIVDLKEGVSKSLKIPSRAFSTPDPIHFKTLSSTLDIIQITIAEKEGNKNLENWLDNNPDVESWGYDQYVQKRAVPDDQYFEMQWGLDLIGAKNAWDVTTGGFDINGNEIVIAVLDDSYDLSHPELEGRIFFNEAEIPDDGIDNDNNGYIDDYQGWNTTNGNDNHPLIDNHGIAVAGIMGAKTNNELGIAGINWQVKILPISGIEKKSEVITGYEYVLNMRKRYNDSNGTEGAYIVVANYSAGIDNAFGTDPQYLAWCNMYEAMGDVGILSTGATANKNVNVDVDGDMPTTCPSEFLLSVTNIDINDTKVISSGYGLENIDLGAPGKGTIALDLDAGYDPSFGGTSAAAPHVAGAIALLYSVPCSAIGDLGIANPRQAAEIIRDAIFEGASSNSTLDGITTSGGRLDIYGAIEALQVTCGEIILTSPKGELIIFNLEIENANTLLTEYVTPDETTYSFLMSDIMGRTIRHFDFSPPTLGRKELRTEIPDLASGIYIISIYNDDIINTKKIFIE